MPVHTLLVILLCTVAQSWATKVHICQHIIGARWAYICTSSDRDFLAMDEGVIETSVFDNHVPARLSPFILKMGNTLGTTSKQKPRRFGFGHGNSPFCFD
ncbi:hypothetical protein QBC32DRAFT_49209 [Pseudoneurospora amorphoporcata]|uniref:Secreted protein n=1 Tax=Pseudoneurospora amorphoporcata TaxID=241081 RepID=A0AAN6NPS2_9PEZI|nr:hypothetical protein QBC32DRAFT_49209 [Pseudoneurospora amorphoporcata]